MATSLTSQTATLSPSDYVRVIRQRIVWVLLPAILLFALIFANGSRQALQYQAEARVLLGNSAAQDSLSSGPQSPVIVNRELSNEISLAKGDSVVGVVEDELGTEPNVTIRADTSSDVLIFAASAASAEDAALHANTWASVYVEAKQSEAASSIDGAVERLTSRLVALRDDRSDATDATQRQLIDGEIAAVSNAITQLQLDGEISALGTARILQSASIPQEPVSSGTTRNAILGAILGLMLGAGLALLLEQLDRSIRTPADIAKAVNLPVLASIPRPDRKSKDDLGLTVAEYPHGPVADGYLKLRTALQFADVSGDIRTVIVTSPNQAEGKTTTASNLAWAMGSLGKKVILADIDLRRPRVHEVYNVPGVPGLTNGMIGKSPAGDLVYTAQGPATKIQVLPAGTLPPSPSDVIASEPFAELLGKLHADSDMLVLDAAPVLPVSDTLGLASKADIVIVTALAGQTTADQLRHAVEALERTQARIAGVVLIGARGDLRYGSKSYYSGEDGKGQRGERGKVTIEKRSTVKKVVSKPAPKQQAANQPVAESTTAEQAPVEQPAAKQTASKKATAEQTDSSVAKKLAPKATSVKKTTTNSAKPASNGTAPEAKKKAETEKKAEGKAPVEAKPAVDVKPAAEHKPVDGKPPAVSKPVVEKATGDTKVKAEKAETTP